MSGPPSLLSDGPHAKHQRQSLISLYNELKRANLVGKAEARSLFFFFLFTYL